MKIFQFSSDIWFWALTIVLGAGGLTATTITFKQGPCLGVRQIKCPSPAHVMFNLFTKENKTGTPLNFLDPRTLSLFNGTNPTKILIHGFNLDSKADAIVEMMKAYLDKGPHNIITADWSAIGKGPDFCYPLASKNTEFVGQCVADLVARLSNKTENIHVIGHSLGARVAGYAANFLKPFVLPRITGLDPTKPMLGKNDLIHKLDATDAAFVDIIHTNVLNQGKVETAGHVDFYVNGGIFQPGCSNEKKSKKLSGVMCSHMRAANYFIESIKSKEGFWGWNCPSLSSAITGSCTISSPAIVMGEPVSHKARGVVHVETRSKSPFSLGPWLMGAAPNRHTPTQSHMDNHGGVILTNLHWEFTHPHHGENHGHQPHHNHNPDNHYHYGNPGSQYHYGNYPGNHYNHGNFPGNNYHHGNNPDYHHHYGNNPDNHHHYGHNPDNHYHYGSNPDHYHYGGNPDYHYSSNVDHHHPYDIIPDHHHNYGGDPDYDHHYGGIPDYDRHHHHPY